ncbi:MAG: MATE family efflux transporter [Clostridia bacterium]|nr:MATE family efflux transporter [Clostridia bacterium]
MKEERSRKMGESPVGRLLISMSLPAIFSMLVQALYNVVDSFFLAGYSTAARDAVMIVYPMQMLVVAFSVGIGIGASTQISRKLGERDREGADQMAKHGLFLSLVCAGLFVLLAFTVVKPFIGMYTKDAAIKSEAVSYLTIVMALSFGSFVEVCLNKILQGTGNMIVPMLTQLVGAITNIILDPILIYGYLGFPAMGAKGAAIATVAGQILAMLFVIICFIRRKQEVSLSLKGFRPRKKYIFGIFTVGIPTTVMNAVGSFTTSSMNGIVNAYEGGITFLGSYFKLQSFVFMPVFGMAQGAMPILSYNYGYNRPDRYKRAFGLFVAGCAGFMLVGLLIFQIFPEALLSLFSIEAELLDKGVYAIRCLSLCFLPAALGISFTNMYQSLGYGKTSLVMSLTRQLVFLLPIAMLLSALGGFSAVWLSYVTAEVIVCLIFVPIGLKVIKKTFAQKQQEITDFAD